MRAQDLFPDIFSDQPEPVHSSQQAGRRAGDGLGEQLEKRTGRGMLDFDCRPLPPDVSWLADGLPDSTSDSNVQPRQCLVISSSKANRDAIKRALSPFGYIPSQAPSSRERSVRELSNPNISLVIGDVADVMPVMHARMLALPIVRRRMVFYVLVGPNLRTLYGLEALSLSANLVVNYSDLDRLELILRKGFRDFEALYGAFLEQLQNGKPAFLS